MSKITEEENNRLNTIASTPYMIPAIKLLNEFLKQGNDTPQQMLEEAYNQIHVFVTQSNADVQAMLRRRKEQGEINDIKQASKSIVGHVLLYLIEYIFIKNKEFNNIGEEFFITSKRQGIKKFNQDLTIHVDNEKQHPDCDLIIYNCKTRKIIILSVKTSLRERAGQSYRWKLLLDIAKAENDELRKKYNISYQSAKGLYFCFATINFYNEINQPQQRGMLKFFDASFIAKPSINSKFISNLSDINGFIKNKLK